MIINLQTAKGATALEEAARKIGEASRLLDQAYATMPAEWQAKLSAVPSAACVELALAARLARMAREMMATEVLS